MTAVGHVRRLTTDTSSAGNVLPIVLYPVASLRMVSEPVYGFDGSFRSFVEDMEATLENSSGLGLAAVQVGVLSRVAVVAIRDADGFRRSRVLANPKITRRSEEVGPYREGCLSIPGQWEDVIRPLGVSVSYRDLWGRACEVDLVGIEARCVQHEIDHMDGRLFVDLVSRLRRDRLLKRYAKDARR